MQNNSDQPNQPFSPNQYGQPNQPFSPDQYGQQGQPFPPTQYGQPGQSGQFNQQYPYNQQPPYTPGGQPPYTPGMQPPYGQPPVPPKKKSKLGLIIGIVVAALVLCGIIGALATRTSSPSTTSTSSPTTQANTSTPTAQATTPSTTTQSSDQGNHKVGETVKVNDNWTAQLLDVKTTPGNDIIKPKPGNVFVVVHLSLKNTSSQTQNMSSLLCFKLQDKNGQAYNETIDPDAGTTPDGKVSANSPLAGSIVYEVPSSQHNFTLQFTPDITSNDMANWDFSI
ncbi:DUF4352 domain-containing protein [Dictyobacter aurantiacus]|uniref:DUF4352 domain-containing protein n=1 Tax=Dictyobacter aurantiacus TaxID=1936993 RepID=A0A401ZAT1_9CHLR|nr:DUF4352 domain-containing protein [Dictyobacter aurantiacus]GCE03974.1 hypothetical protein KDAU_13030 [Dictyobacter aurantiacus]